MLAEHGWIGLIWPTEFGGGGKPPIDRLIVGEEMIKAGAPIAASWFADRQMGPTLITYGRPDQQAEFLPKILSGETTWCRLAQEVFHLAHLNVSVRPIATAEYPTKARRPAWSVLNTGKLAAVIGAPLPSWQASLAEYLANRSNDGRR